MPDSFAPPAQGLDGEATEPIVSSLTDPEASRAAPEQEFQVAAVLTQSASRHLLMLTKRLSAVVGGKGADPLEAAQLIRLLHYAAQLQVCSSRFQQ